VEPIIREKNDINYSGIDKTILEARYLIVLDWLTESSGSVQNVIEYDWSDDVGIMDNASDTEKAQSLANWIIKNRADLTIIRYDDSLSENGQIDYKRLRDDIARKQLFLRHCLKKSPKYLKKELLLMRGAVVLSSITVALVLLLAPPREGVVEFLMSSFAVSLMIVIVIVKLILIPRKSRKLVAQERMKWRD
jgi:hypothetical protein